VKVLTIHNKYQVRGGEDESCEAEGRLLVANGHELSRITFENDAITKLNASSAGLQAAWRHSSYKRVLDEIRTTRPDIVNVHNFFPVASPAVYYAARKCGVPVVQTLHNYRLLCPSAILFRDGKVCEECVGKSVPWPGVAHGCYRDSRSATLAVTSMLSIHNLLGTWVRYVDMFIALSEFSRRKFIEGGLPAKRLTVKPNFLASDPGSGSGAGNYVLYVGRLTEEKGLRNLIDAWKAAACPGRLIIAGEGPLASFVEGEASCSPSVSFLGRRTPEQVYDLLADARALVFPSTWYEGMPRVIVEALSRGTPVIATRIGSMTEMISEGRNGWLVPPGNVQELAASIGNVFRFGGAMAEIRASARRDFEDKYTAERNYNLLMGIYRDVIAERIRTRPLSLLHSSCG
jgi:glycosyltransferase involved in cell wall biosynthesis